MEISIDEIVESIPVIGGGEVGGKAKGFFLSRYILTNYLPEEFRAVIRFPDAFVIGTNVFDRFLKINPQLEEIIKLNLEGSNEENYKRLEQEFLSANFPEEIRIELRKILENLKVPLVARSSSLEEDSERHSFAGKYYTFFTSNNGEKELDQRVDELIEKIVRVYASTYNPDAIEYRNRRGLDHRKEKMAVMIQNMVGIQYKRYFLPYLGGVGFSKNYYIQTMEIKKEDGLLRLVFGLGTRAVGRRFALTSFLSKPTARPDLKDYSFASIKKASQQRVDVLDLKTNELVVVDFGELVGSYAPSEHYPGSEKLISIFNYENETLFSPYGLWINPQGVEKRRNLGYEVILTLDEFLRTKVPGWGFFFSDLSKIVLKTLERGFGSVYGRDEEPVDIEFALGYDEDGKLEFNFLQGRPLSQREDQKPAEIPTHVPKREIIFKENNIISNGRISDIEYIVYVDPRAYNEAGLRSSYSIAREIGKINQQLKGKRFALVGPGRWGNNDGTLGVPVKEYEIDNASILVEMSTEQFSAEASFGTHFFQVLFENGIAYAALSPDRGKNIWNRQFLLGSGNMYEGSNSDVIRVIHVPAITDGKYLEVCLNADRRIGLFYLRK